MGVFFGRQQATHCCWWCMLHNFQLKVNRTTKLFRVFAASPLIIRRTHFMWSRMCRVCLYTEWANIEQQAADYIYICHPSAPPSYDVVRIKHVLCEHETTAYRFFTVTHILTPKTQKHAHAQARIHTQTQTMSRIFCSFAYTCA